MFQTFFFSEFWCFLKKSLNLQPKKFKICTKKRSAAVSTPPAPKDHASRVKKQCRYNTVSVQCIRIFQGDPATMHIRLCTCWHFVVFILYFWYAGASESVFRQPTHSPSTLVFFFINKISHFLGKKYLENTWKIIYIYI